ncbi:MAG: methyl-accepting chemotaxis protein [Chloroflexi bacterium]|nr:methyl-accepting chemotaxis protein [Chloroflexota bacterium]
MRKMTLSWRLALAFGALILLMCVLGGLAVARMGLATSSTTRVSAMRVPVVDVAFNLDTSAWKTRFYISDYALTGDPEMLKVGRKALAEIYVRLTEADNLAKKYPDLVALRQGAIEGREKVTEFETGVDAIEAEHKNLAELGIALDAAAKNFVDAVTTLRVSERQHANAEADAKAAPAVLRERIVKMGMVEDIARIEDGIRIKNFKYQNARDMDALSAVLKDFDALDEAIASLRPLLHVQEDIQELEKTAQSASDYRIAMEQLLKSRVSVEKQMNTLLSTGDLVSAAAAISEDGLKTITEESGSVTNGLSLTSLILIIGLVIAFIVGVLIAWFSTRAITRPIREGVNTLAAASGQISTTVSQLASNASEAAAAVAETTTTVEEVRQTAQVSADKAKTVAENAQVAASAAEAGRQATGQTVEGMNLMRDQMSSIIESITRLSEQSVAVGDIVSTVTDLAEQSNLLAVNASIEAAKAGDMGKGFAVVAQEIRTLAEQSKDSTKQVRAILTDVQKATAKAVLAAEQGGKSVAEGSRQAGEAGQAISTLTSSVQDASRAAVQIAASSQQQLAGMDQVGRAMENIKLATSQNAEGARQLGLAAHNLLEVGARLKALVDAGDGVASGAGRHENTT